MADLHDPVLQIRRLDPDATIPSYAFQGDAGLDLASSEDAVLAPFERRIIKTGLSVAIPEGFAGFVLSRSGTASRLGLTMVNAPGLIDSEYRGELKIAAINLDPSSSVEIHRGDRIAQLVVMRTPSVTVLEVDALDATSRGKGGFGSSGV